MPRLNPAQAINELVQAVYKNDQNINEFVAQANESMRRLALFHAAASDSIIEELKHATDPVNEVLRRLNKSIDGFVKANQKAVDCIHKCGWWITPSLAQIPVTSILQSTVKYHEGNKNAISKMIISYYSRNDWEILGKVISEWQDNPLLSKRLFIIDEAFWALKQKKYALVAPVLLAQADGIARDYCRLNKIGFHRNKGNVNIKKAVNNDLSKVYYSEVFLQMIEKLFGDTKTVPSKTFNRHRILHGININYANRVRALQSFLLLEILSSLELSESKISKVTGS